MAALEEQGYLTQPHTSAGRIPTDKGYRFFVDRLREAAPSLGPADRATIREFFRVTHGELESMLDHTSELLSEPHRLDGRRGRALGRDRDGPVGLSSSTSRATW